MQKRPSPRRIGSRVIVTTNLTQDAVTNVELAPNSVTADTLAPNSVTGDAIEPGSITSTELAEDAGGANTTFTPTAPASPVLGDLWFDSSDNVTLKRWSGTAWVSMRDLGIAAAAAGAAAADAAATAAQTTADGKNKVYRQTAEPTGGTYAEGDLWFDTDDNNKIYRRTSSAWTAVQLGGEALANINANKITAGSIDASVITVSNLNAGNITAGTIAAARITSASIAAADIDAARITAGVISSARITSDSISAASINADRITAGTVNLQNASVTSGSSGARLTIDATGIKIYNAAGTNTTSLLSDGSATFAGTLSGATGSIGSNLTVGNNVRINGAAGDGGVSVVKIRADSQPSPPLITSPGRQPLQVVSDLNNPAFRVVYNGDCRYGASMQVESDARLKKDIEKETLGLDFIKSLNPVSFHWDKPEFISNERKYRGFIAQEVLEVSKKFDNQFEAVFLEDDNDPESFLSLDSTQFIAPLVKAVQELSARVAELEAKK